MKLREVWPKRSAVGGDFSRGGSLGGPCEARKRNENKNIVVLLPTAERYLSTELFKRQVSKENPTDCEKD